MRDGWHTVLVSAVTMKPLDLTIVIPAKNEERNLANCLRAIGPDFARHIVVVDSGSADKTAEIARDSGAEVIEFNWNGQFPKKRNWYLRNHAPQTRWILFLDADEFLTKQWKAEVRRELPNSDKAGYWLAYSIYFLGKRLRHGYPLDKLALFRVGAGEYERIDEDRWSALDMEIHEHPVLDGEVASIKSRIDHRDFRGVSYYVEKHNEYSSWEAHRYLKMKNNAALLREMTWKQKIKYKILNSPLSGLIYFFGAYFIMGGIWDGVRGLTFALLKMNYFTQIYCKVRELETAQKRGE